MCGLAGIKIQLPPTIAKNYSRVKKGKGCGWTEKSVNQNA